MDQQTSAPPTKVDGVLSPMRVHRVALKAAQCGRSLT